MKPFATQSHYEVLEISVSASTQEVQAAYERLRQLYDGEQLALYGLVEPEQAHALRAQLSVARDTLSDEAARAAYDQTLGLPPQAGEPGAAAPALPAEPSAPSMGQGLDVVQRIAPVAWLAGGVPG